MIALPTRPRGASTPWLISFADLLGVLLCFFVLIYTTRTHEGAWTGIAASLASTFGRVAPVAQPPQGGEREASDLTYLAAVLDARLDAEMKLVREADRLVIAIPVDLLFRDGDALGAAGEARLARLAPALANVRNRIEIWGHADPQPVAAPFASNWALSLARAAAVARGLEQAGLPVRPPAFGLGDARFTEIPASLPLAERYARARRVDLVIREGRTSCSASDC
jgi:chemotaxis protein MotB